MIDGIRSVQEIVIAALGSLTLFFVALAFLKTWMRGGS